MNRPLAMQWTRGRRADLSNQCSGSARPPAALAATGPLPSLGESLHVGTQGAGLGLRDAYALSGALFPAFGTSFISLRRVSRDTSPCRTRSE